MIPCRETDNKKILLSHWLRAFKAVNKEPVWKSWEKSFQQFLVKTVYWTDDLVTEVVSKDPFHVKVGVEKEINEFHALP